jgi:cytidylate kinase
VKEGEREPVITIDGPAGAGKTTVARALARRLGYRLVDTGAMYRALAWSVRQTGLGAEDTPELRRHLDAVAIEVHDARVFVDGREVTEEIRGREITDFTSRLSMLGPVREKIVPMQRRMAGAGGVILEGRDTGTIVCPDAEAKFYLDATLEERARRRQAEFRSRGVDVDFAEVYEELGARDRQDMARALAPLVPAADAIYIPTTGVPVERVVDRMVREIEQRCCTRS